MMIKSNLGSYHSHVLTPQTPNTKYKQRQLIKASTLKYGGWYEVILCSKKKYPAGVQPTKKVTGSTSATTCYFYYSPDINMFCPSKLQ